MKRRLRAFNERGLNRFGEALRSIDGGQGFDISQLIDDDDVTISANGEIVVAPRFRSRFDMAAYLTPIVLSSALPNPLEHRGLWSWVAACWMEPILAGLPDSRRKVGGPQRWLLATNEWQAYYRHLLAGPCSIVAQHLDDDVERCRVLLTGEIHQPGTFYDDAASQQRTVRSPGLLDAMTRLYLQPDGQLRPGAIGPKGTPGTIRRFTKYLDRLELTYDLQSISASALLDGKDAILSAEFRDMAANIALP